ncbi:MAG: SRPBCC domain-containing protein [Candidatus Omnitrophica bacterium]|nr:SRPBCC domain-containing protein [Candidatus Omnitrophota bacterium]
MTPEPKKRDLIFTRVFDVSAEALWRAWTEAELVMRWWGPAGFTSPSAKMDVREGGTSIVCMRAPEWLGGQDMYSAWRYARIVPLERIEYIHNLSDSNGTTVDPVQLGMPPDFPRDVRNLVTFKDLGNGKTELVVTEFDWPEGQMMELSKVGMEQCLDKMAAIFGKK